MGLAVAADVALGADEHGRVEQLHAVLLGQAADEVHAVLCRERDPALHRRAVRHGLGMGEGLGAAVEAVAGGRQFGQHDELRTAGHRSLELLAHGSGVAREVLDADLRVELHDGHAHGAGAQAGHGVAAGGNVYWDGHGHFRFQIKTRWMLAASVLICNQSNATV
ncbi:hypothetical protein D9M69_525260 [compost metagenome]